MSGEAPPRGLPEHLPAGETILWQGAPDAAALARDAFHTRGVSIYFALLTAGALVVSFASGGGLVGAIATAACGVAAVALLRLLAWAQARMSVYTLTDRRIVMRIGVALPTSINLPLGSIEAVGLSDRGDVTLTLAQTPALGWVVLWPHAQPWRVARPVPMLRCLADGEAAAMAIGAACQRVAAVQSTRATPMATTPAAPVATQPMAVPA